MEKGKHSTAHHNRPAHYFSNFLEEPLIASSFVVIALITLMFALMEFTRAMAY